MKICIRCFVFLMSVVGIVGDVTAAEINQHATITTDTPAPFKNPSGITNDGNNLYVSDSGNNRIRKIEIATGKVFTLAGTFEGAIDGIGVAAGFRYPYGITVVGNNLFVSDEMNRRIRKIEIVTGAVTTLAGSGLGDADGIGTSATFSAPAGITTDGNNLFVADTFNCIIRRIVIATGQVTTLAGSGAKGDKDGLGKLATFNYPSGLVTDGSNLYVADVANNKIRKVVIATQMVTTLAGSGKEGASDGIGIAASFSYPENITINGNNLYVSDFKNNKIRKVEIASGVVTTLAGSGAEGFADGIGTAASFHHPRGLTSDGKSLYVADVLNSSIRKIVISTGAVSTVVVQETPRVSAQAAALGDGGSPKSNVQQADYLLKVCSEIPTLAEPTSAERGIDPAGTVAVELENRALEKKINRDIFGDQAAMSSFKVTQLERPTHGKLVANTSGAGRIYYMYFINDAESGYVGKDKAVFMIEFEGKTYRVVYDMTVGPVEAVGEGSCPPPKLTKINGKQVSTPH
jgi:sugar lactone lactonase YvrE